MTDQIDEKDVLLARVRGAWGELGLGEVEFPPVSVSDTPTNRASWVKLREGMAELSGMSLKGGSFQSSGGWQEG